MSDSLLFHVSLLFVFDGAVCRRLLFLGENRKNKRTFPENVCLVRKGWIYELMEVTKDCLVFADVGRPSVLHGLSCHWAHLRSLLWLLGRFLRPLCCHRCRVFRFSGDAAGVVLFYTLGIWLGLLYILSSDNNVKKIFREMLVYHFADTKTEFSGNDTYLGTLAFQCFQHGNRFRKKKVLTVMYVSASFTYSFYIRLMFQEQWFRSKYWMNLPVFFQWCVLWLHHWCPYAHGVPVHYESR